MGRGCVSCLHTTHRLLDWTCFVVVCLCPLTFCFFFFFNDTATTEIYTLSLHDALPISRRPRSSSPPCCSPHRASTKASRSEEHTSELQSPCNLVCRLLLEKKKNNSSNHIHTVNTPPR